MHSLSLLWFKIVPASENSHIVKVSINITYKSIYLRLSTTIPMFYKTNFNIMPSIFTKNFSLGGGIYLEQESY